MKYRWKRIARSQLNEQRWMQCVISSASNQLYGHPNFLDSIADEWHCWVFGDYEVVLPLPVRTKYGVQYVYQPEFYQRTELYSKTKRCNSIPDLTEVMDRYLKVDLTYLGKKIDSANPLTNYYLSANQEIQLSKNTERNIQKFQKSGLSVNLLTNPKGNQILEHFKINTRFKLNPDFEGSFCRVMDVLSSSNQLNVYGISENPKMGYAVVCTLGNRHTLILLSTSDKGRKIGLAHAMVFQAVKKALSEKKDFDFEGSNHAGIARFYKSFGAVQELYWHYQKNLSKGLLNRILKKA